MTRSSLAGSGPFLANVDRQVQITGRCGRGRSAQTANPRSADWPSFGDAALGLRGDVRRARCARQSDGRARALAAIRQIATTIEVLWQVRSKPLNKGIPPRERRVLRRCQSATKTLNQGLEFNRSSRRIRRQSDARLPATVPIGSAHRAP